MTFIATDELRPVLRRFRIRAIGQIGDEGFCQENLLITCQDGGIATTL